MDEPLETAGPRPPVAAERTFYPPIALTGVAGAALAALVYLVGFELAMMTSSASGSLSRLLAAVIGALVAGILGGIATIVLLRRRLAGPVRELKRFAELAAQAGELGQRLSQRAALPYVAEHRASSPVRMPASATEEPDETDEGTPAMGTRSAGTRSMDAPAQPAHRRSAERGSASARTAPDGGPLEPGVQFTTVINQLMTALDDEQSYRSIVDATGDVVLLVDSLGQICIASESVEQVLGLPASKLINQPLARYVHANDLERLLDLLEDFDTRTRPDRRKQRPRLRLRAADDSWRVLEWVLSPWTADQRGSTLLTGRDVTEQVALQEELVHQAQHDALTGLPNRIALTARLSQLVATASIERPVAVLMIDLDRFKMINDSLGHAYGDVLLTQVGARLEEVLRPGDMIARLGGDEFAVVVHTASQEGAQLVAERLVSQLEDAFPVKGANLIVEASIGIAISHGTARTTPADSATLLSEADIAMYRAKETGTVIAVFEPERDQAKSQRLELSDELRDAISAGQLVMHYQPIIDIRNLRVAGLEALVRWQHPERGLLPPSQFLPLAEETGLISRLSLAVLDQSLAQAAIWLGQGWPLPVSVNLSPNWLHQADVPSEVAAALERHGLPAALLRLEITEAAVLVDPQQSLARLHRLREMGVGLSLDDFGTGFSSMTHLRTLPIDQLKVDRTFVGTMVTSEQDAVIVRAAIELGHNLGLSVVAEGIEDPDTLARVMGAGCSLAQGYYFTKPIPASQVLTWIEPRFPATLDDPATVGDRDDADALDDPETLDHLADRAAG